MSKEEVFKELRNIFYNNYTIAPDAFFAIVIDALNQYYDKEEKEEL